MYIHHQIKNLLKLLLIGAVLFCFTIGLSTGCRTIANAKQSYTVNSKKIYANASMQIRPESPDLLFINKNTVKAAIPPTVVTPQVMAAIVGDGSYQETDDSSKLDKSIIEYSVEPNDTLAGIAQKFNLKTQTILWANNLSSNSTIKPGQILIIPPVDGIIYNVVAGDTLSKIAQTYKTDEGDIIAFNELQNANDLFIGDQLIIPGGIMPPAPSKPAPVNTVPALPGNYFLCPVATPCTKTQGLHYNNAVDLSHGKCGEPVYAAASGTVIRAKTGGWNSGAGNYITILHPSGAITKYYHLQTIFVVPGQAIAKGQNIGLIGSSGNSTGCHLHFELTNTSQTNPFAR